MGKKITKTPPTIFKRTGAYRFLAFVFGQTKFKSVVFEEHNFSINSKRLNLSNRYSKIKNINMTGFILKKITFDAGFQRLTFRGLSQKDADRLTFMFQTADRRSWLHTVEPYSEEIKLLANWIDDVWTRKYFQRLSVYNSRVKKAHKLVDKIGARIPGQLVGSNEALQFAKVNNFLKVSDTQREQNNDEYIPLELARQKTLFDKIENNPLTVEQGISVVTDEDANLVVASAGSGKTSVIVAKAAWLLQKGLRKSDEILLLAFASDARIEMKKRLSQRIADNSADNISVHTFHSLGRSIIIDATGIKPQTSKLAEDKIAFLNFIKDAIRSNLQSAQYRQKMTRWFSEFFAPYRSEFDFENQGAYWDYLKKNNIRSLKGVGEIRSLKAEKVKSFEECEIANFLYLNGINYVYEKDYEYNTSSKDYKQYQPDFYLPDYGIYIEHWGLRGFGRTAPFVDRKKYLSDLRWKRNEHKKNKTTLVETYSCEKSQGILLPRLEEKLQKKGVVFEEIDGDQVFEILKEKGQIDPFTALVSTFLGHYKGSNLNKDLLRQNNEEFKGQVKERNNAFIDVFLPVFESYQQTLISENKIDFHDMISQAIDLIKKGKYQTPFRYIMVDEFQDMSIGRSKLISALQSLVEDSQLFCVGDDWQAIFRFAGSDINLMKEFGGYFGHFEQTVLSKTFRSEEKITNHSTNFILQNKAQIPKSVSSFQKSEHPSVYISFKKQVNVDQQSFETEIHLAKMLYHIANDHNSDQKPEVLILGRYNLDIYQKLYSTDYKATLVELERKYPAFNIVFKTAHRSKGLEADYVIVLEVVNHFIGFPNERADDHVLDLVLAKAEDFPNSEERRLFYVALTRAKKKVFISTTSGMSSEFVNELIQNPYECEIWGTQTSALPSCPKCKDGRFILKMGQYGTFWGCSNHPYCDSTSDPCPHCKQGYPKPNMEDVLECDVCEQPVAACPEKACDGHLQQKNGSNGIFWGCSNYKSTGCRHTQNSLRYTRNASDPDNKKNTLRTKQSPSKSSVKVFSPSSDEIEVLRKVHPNAYKPWSELEDQRLRELVSAGKSDQKISDLMGRQEGAIRSRKDKLAL